MQSFELNNSLFDIIIWCILVLLDTRYCMHSSYCKRNNEQNGSLTGHVCKGRFHKTIFFHSVTANYYMGDYTILLQKCTTDIVKAFHIFKLFIS